MNPRLERIAKYKEIFAKAVTADKVNPTTNAVFLLSRELARNDLFFLMYMLCGREDINHDWLFARCVELQGAPDGYLDLWSREHRKSSLITFGLTIQDILKNPETTACILSHTRPIAKGFLRQIKQEFEGNDKLKALFPDILYQEPHKESPKWSEDEGITVKRKNNPREATVEAFGLVDGQPTGRHYGLLVYDDVVTKESVSTPEMIAKTTQAWELSLNLGTDGGRARYIGTRYHHNDTYAQIMERGVVKPRIYPATKDGSLTGKPVLFSPAYFKDKVKSMGVYVAGCQLLQDPRADKAQGFRKDWLKYWKPVNISNLNRYILCDPASSKKKESDYTAIFIVGLGPDMNYYVIDMVRDRLSLTEKANLLFDLHKMYKPLAVGYERYGMMADIEHIQDRMERQNYRFDIVEVKGQTSKEDRIKKLVPLFEYGRVYLPEKLSRTVFDGRTVDVLNEFINDEYLAFPVCAHDDMLDCLARILSPELNVSFPAANNVSAFAPKRKRRKWKG